MGSAAVALAAADITALLLADRESQLLVACIFLPLIGLSFVAGGLVAWTRRPANGTGRLMAAVGLLWLLGGLWESDHRLVYSIGAALGSVFLAAFVHLVLAYPRGRLETRLERRVVPVLYAIALLAGVLPSLFEPAGHGCEECPSSVLLITPSASATDALQAAFTAAGIVIFLAVLGLLVRRWRRSTPAARRLLGPVYLSGGLTLGLIGLAFGADFASEDVTDALHAAAFTAFAAVPLFFLAGVLRTRLQRASVARLLLDVPDEPTPEEAQAGLRRALRDPTLRLLMWLEESGIYVDVEGNPFDRLPSSPGRTASRLDYEGRPLAAVVHDTALTHEPELLEEVLAVARLALEKDRGLQALRRSEARNRALIDALPDLMFRISRDGTYLAFKGEPDQLVGSADGRVGAHVRDVLPPEVAEPYLACLQRALDGGIETLEYALDLHGERRYYEARMVPAGEDEVVVIVRDFTERRRLEEELQRRLEEIEREQEFTRTVVNTAPIVVLVADTEGRIVRFNETCERLFGHRDGDRVRGRFFWDVFLPPEHHGIARASLERLLSGERLVRGEGKWLTASGSSRVMDWYTTPIVDGEGHDRFLLCALDVTERIHQQEELRASRARIVEATDDARRRLERNLHDGAQQRLVSLSLALRLAQGKLREDPDAAERLLAGASDELTHALAELRELARGIHPAVLTDRGLGAALETLAGRAPVPVQLSTELEERLPGPVEAAAYYVVAEALTNVVKYADASAVQVRAARENGRVVVEVADDGVGGADPRRGSGLRGLADRVEALDGQLEVDSADGSGTRVRAVIPVA